MDKYLNPSAIKALAFDLDGTLLKSDRTISGRSLRILRLCMERDIRLIIATGRSLESGEKYREQIGMTGPQVYYNGAEVADTNAGKIIHTQFVDSRLVLFCVRLARQMGLYYQVYFPAGTVDMPYNDSQGSKEILMADRGTLESEGYENSSGIKVVTGDLEEHLKKVPAVIKGMFITEERNHEKIRPILREQFGDSIYIIRSSPVFLETLAPGVSKGVGLAHALEYLHLKPENTIAFGDEENDLSMFETAGFSAAPANATKDVQKAAMFQIPANTEDGIAVFMEKLLGGGA